MLQRAIGNDGAAEAGAVGAEVHPEGHAPHHLRRELRGAVGHRGRAGRAVAGAALRLDQAADLRRPCGGTEVVPLS